MRTGVGLHLFVTNQGGLVGNVKHSLECGDHEMVEFEILRAVRRVHSNLITLDSRRVDLVSSRVSLVECYGRVSWKKE